MLNSLSDCPCRQCMFNSRNTPLRYSTAPSCNVWTFEAFKEAEAFKRVAAESLSNDHRTMTWTAEKWCKHTESTEPANGSGSSSWSSTARSLLSLAVAEQRQQEMTRIQVIWNDFGIFVDIRYLLSQYWQRKIQNQSWERSKSIEPGTVRSAETELCTIWL